MDEQTDSESAMKMEGDESARWHFKNSFFSDGLFLNSFRWFISTLIHPSFCRPLGSFMYSFIYPSIDLPTYLSIHLHLDHVSPPCRPSVVFSLFFRPLLSTFMSLSFPFSSFTLSPLYFFSVPPVHIFIFYFTCVSISFVLKSTVCPDRFHSVLLFHRLVPVCHNSSFKYLCPQNLHSVWTLHHLYFIFYPFLLLSSWCSFFYNSYWVKSQLVFSCLFFHSSVMFSAAPAVLLTSFSFS